MNKEEFGDHNKDIQFKTYSTDAYAFSNGPEANIANSTAKLFQDQSGIHKSGLFSRFKLKLNISGGKKISQSCEESADVDIKIYKRRFWMLFIYSVSSMMNALLWIQFSSIANIIQCYYQVDAYAVNWTSNIYLVVYIITVLPISWFMDRFGLKPTVIVGCVTNCLSTAIQCCATNRGDFPILFVSQTIAGVGNAIVLPIPPRLAAVWFAADEVCRATAVGVFGNQLGIALGFLIPSMVISSDCSDPELIKHDLSIMTYCLTGVNFINLLLIILTYERKPPLPPSEVSKSEVKTEYKTSLLNLVKNCNFQWLVLTYGLTIGVSLSMSALLNQMLSPIFAKSEREIGWMGMSQIVAGFVGALLAGYILDKTHKFKLISMIICAFGLLSTGSFIGIIHVSSIWAPFAIVTLTGFFINGFFPVGLEFASEITYPEPEGTVAGLMNASTMLFALVFTSAGSYLQQNYGTLTTCIFFCVGMAISSVTCVIIKPELRRTEKNMYKSKSASNEGKPEIQN